ncbi:MAG: creatininase family protein [Caldilineaceae bacterium]
MRFGDLTYLEIRDKAAAGWLAVIPTGCTEQQGPHLPVDFDTWFVETLTLAAAEYAAREHDVHALVLPALPFGPTPEHRNFGSGYIDLPEAVHDAILMATLHSLATQGFRRMIIWRGCGGHRLEQVVADFNLTYHGRAQAFLPPLPFHDLWCRVGDATIPGGHADSFATSMAFYLRPGSVRTNLIANPHNGPVDWADPKLDFAAYSSSGVIGDPTHASAALGEKLWQGAIKTVAQILAECTAA